METAYNAPAGLRREIETVLKKKIITSNSCRAAGQKGKGEQEALQ